MGCEVFYMLKNLKIIINLQMRTVKDDDSFVKAPPNSYVRVSQHTKDKLAYMVMIQGLKVSSAAKILKINDSTAKMTIRSFKLLPKEQQQQILINGSIKKKDKVKNGEVRVKEEIKEEQIKIQSNLSQAKALADVSQALKPNEQIKLETNFQGDTQTNKLVDKSDQIHYVVLLPLFYPVP